MAATNSKTKQSRLARLDDARKAANEVYGACKCKHCTDGSIAGCKLLAKWFKIDRKYQDEYAKIYAR